MTARAAAVALVALAAAGCGGSPAKLADGAAVVDSSAVTDATVLDLAAPTDQCAPSPTDPENCGGCGRPCCPGNACSSGRCFPGCASGMSACPACAGAPDCGACWGGTCVDTATDPANCGACAHACPTGQRCVNAVCGL